MANRRVPRPQELRRDREPTVHHRSARQRRARPAARAQLNLAAMIDVIFLLLIFFVVTASFAMDEGVLEAHMPAGTGEARDALAPPSEPLRIRLEATGSTQVRIRLGRDREVAGFAALADELEALQYAPERGRSEGLYRADDPVLIESEGAVRWQHVVNAFNAAVKSEYANVRFAQRP